MRWIDTDLQVRYGDTDQMGVVHNSVHTLYCEIGRIGLCDALGLPYFELEKAGYYLMVAEMRGRYHAPIRYGEGVYVKAGIARLKKRLMEIDYEIRKRASDQLCFTGSTTHVFTNRNHVAVSLPSPYYDLFAKGLEERSG